MSGGPTLRQLLFALGILVLAIPLIAAFFFPVFDSYLMRQTERRLISESVLIAEAWRDRLLEGRRLVANDASSFRPSGRETDRYAPFVAVVDLAYEVLPPALEPTRFADVDGSPEGRAGAAISPLLHRAQVFNLSGARVLNTEGCVVASSGSDIGACLDHLEEVRTALAGRYHAVVRQRISDEPPPPLASIRRRGLFRVFTATPVYENGEVIGVVRMARTSVSPLESLYTHRGKVALVLILCLVVISASAFMLSRAIAEPLRLLTRSADARARGEPESDFAPGLLTPRELRTLGLALDRMTKQITGRAEYIREFATNLSHELKTPLTGITGAIELLREESDAMSDVQRQRFLDNVSSDARRMEELVARLLELARIQSAPEEADSIDLEPFLETLCDRYDAPIELRVMPGLPLLVMNRGHLENAVRNLIDNAIRYRNGRPVEVSADLAGDRIRLEVRDHGPGISEANQGRIFDRFFTTARDQGGTGLGLSIVRAVAETRDGHVEFETGPTGTVFRLLL